MLLEKYVYKDLSARNEKFYEELYQAKDGNFLETFSTTANQEQVEKLIQLNQELLARRLPVLKMSKIKLPDGTWGITMPHVAGEGLNSVIFSLNDRKDSPLTNPQAIRLHNQAVKTICTIDEITGNFGSRHIVGSVDREDFENFIATQDGNGDYSLINIKPLDMGWIQTITP